MSPSFKNFHWSLPSFSERDLSFYTSVLCPRTQKPLGDFLGRLLMSRCPDPSQISTFLDPTLKTLLPNPFTLKDMEKGAARLWQAIQNKENITIFGDYDVDGATSSALLIRFLRALGLSPTFYIPDRVKEGYGPSVQAFQYLKSQGTSLLITVDSGTTAYDPLTWAHENGLDVIVIDHHVSPPLLPPCVALINPNRFDASDAFLGSLAAVGVAFLFVIATNSLIKKEFSESALSNAVLFSLLDLVALGTVCDVMPLTGLNRAFVAQGLKIMAQRSNLGLKTLCDIARLGEVPTAYHLGFVLGPRINAGGRIGDSRLGTLLLTTEDSYEAQRIAQRLDQLNQERKELEDLALEEAYVQAQEQIDQLTERFGKATFLVLDHPEWHQGIIGLVASRVKDRFHLPTFAISWGEEGGKGSGRSVPGIDLGALVHQAHQQNFIAGGGGHPMAAGVSLEREHLEKFHNFLCEKTQDYPASAFPSLEIDMVLSCQSLKEDLLETLQRLAPFGQGNPQPRFLMSGLRVVFISIMAEKHLKLTLEQRDGQRCQALAFRSVGTPLGDNLLRHQNRLVDIVGTLSPDLKVFIEDAAFSS